MRPSMQRIATPARTLLQSKYFVATSRPLRCFHTTFYVAEHPERAERRGISTSGRIRAAIDERNGGNNNSINKPLALTAGVLGSDPQGQELQNNQKTQQQQSKKSKRKAARSVASKNLRKASIINKNVIPEVTTAPKPADNGDEDDDSSYQNTIRAICIAQSFDMDKVAEILRYQGFVIDPDGTDIDAEVVVHARGAANNGDIFVFASGTVVGWSIEAELLKDIAVKHLLRAAEIPQVDKAEVEDLEFVIDSSRDTSYVKGETVILGTDNAPGSEVDTTFAKIAFSSGLARSPKLALLENLLTEFLERSRSMAVSITTGSESRLSRTSVLRLTGELLDLRSQLNHYSDLTDSLPDIFWDRESKFEGYYERIGHVLDVKSRIAQLNKKIDYAHELVTVLREVSSEKQSRRLEWIIIALIAVEVVFELRRVYMESVEENQTHHSKKGLALQDSA